VTDPDETLLPFAEEIRKRRTEIGMDSGTLAVQLGRTPETISRIENGRMPLPGRDLPRLLEVLGARLVVSTKGGAAFICSPVVAQVLLAVEANGRQIASIERLGLRARIVKAT
jgi:transcriptional regulator with XRE-family HTH domain